MRERWKQKDGRETDEMKDVWRERERQRERERERVGQGVLLPGESQKRNSPNLPINKSLVLTSQPLIEPRHACTVTRKHAHTHTQAHAHTQTNTCTQTRTHKDKPTHT